MNIELLPDRVNRAGWPKGPWDNEPDKVNWTYNGMPCMIVRNDMGALCGYVGVKPGEPLFETPYEGCSLNVHGELTYSDHCQGDICHTPDPGEPDHIWWLGFDCFHCMDKAPGWIVDRDGFLDMPTELSKHYWTIPEVKKEVERLADQIKVYNESHQS